MNETKVIYFGFSVLFQNPIYRKNILKFTIWGIEILSVCEVFKV